MSNVIRLGDYITEISEKTTMNNQYMVLTSSQEGIVSQDDYFNKQVASKDNTGYKIIRRGQFTYRAMSDTGRFYINRLNDYDIGIVSPAYPVFELRTNGQILPEYLQEYFHSEHFQNAITLSSTGSTRVSLKLAKIADLRIDIPTLPKQQCAVQAISHVNHLISMQNSSAAKLDQLVKSRFVEMFGEPETNPYGWRKTTVGDVCSSVVRGPFGSALKKEFFVEPNGSTYKVYEQKHAIQKSATIGTYYISAEKFGELRRFECRPGDILMSCSGTMGELFQLPSGCECGVINQALCKFTLSDCILPIVFLTYMRQTIGNLETKGSGIQNIAAVSYVKAMPINLPPMEVQRRFAAFVAEIDKSKLSYEMAVAA